MISAILINDKPLGTLNPTEVNVEINGITSDATRSDSGDLTVLNKVNSIAKVSLSWDYLSIEDMEKLCSLLHIDVANYGEKYATKDLNNLSFKVTARLPMGIKSFNAYVGDTIAATLHDNSGNVDDTIIGGEYWQNIRIALIGTGEQWKHE